MGKINNSALNPISRQKPLLPIKDRTMAQRVKKMVLEGKKRS